MSLASPSTEHDLVEHVAGDHRQRIRRNEVQAGASCTIQSGGTESEVISLSDTVVRHLRYHVHHGCAWV